MNKKMVFLGILLLIGLTLSGCVAGGYGHGYGYDYGHGYYSYPRSYHYYDYGYPYRHHRDWDDHRDWR